MIADLKPYAEYKESGLPWLGRVPGHWEMRRLRHACEMRVSNVDKHTTAGEIPVRLCNYVEVYKNERIRATTRFMAATATQDERTRFRIRKGDVLITKDSEQWNDIGVPALVECDASDLVCGYHLAILRARDGLIGAYLHRALESHWIAPQFHVEANGVTRYGLSHGAIQSVGIPLPPPDEQAAIVRFLDWANGRLERAIRAKRKVIALLNEQKQAIIHRAVTRGLDPSVPMKDSGVSWLGEIPAHWEVRRLKHCISPIEQGWSPQCDAQPADDDEWGVLKVGCVNKDVFSPKQNKKLPLSLQPDHSLEVRDGDVLVSRANTKQLLGLAALAENPPGKRILCDKLFRFRAKGDSFNPKFAVLALRAKPCRAQIESSTNGASSSMQNIGQGVLKNLWVAMPSVAEQDSIVTHIAVATQPASVAISRLEREIDLLREYRTRLVADVVTGKLDVRAMAAGLPDEGALEPEVDGEGLSNEDEGGEEAEA